MNQECCSERIAPLGLSAALRSGTIRTFLLLLLASSSCAVHAGEHRFQLLLDTDNSTTTGCLVATARGPVSGIEQVWTTVVTTTTSAATVSRIERQTCVGTTLGSSSVQTAGWSAGLANGSVGTAALESFVPLSFLPTHGTMRVSVASTNATGGQDATASFLISLDPVVPPTAVTPVPLSPWVVLPLGLLLFATAVWWRRRHPNQGSLLGCMLLVVVSSLVWAATVTLDGNVGDWSGIVPVAGNAAGSAPIDANIAAVFYQSDAVNLYFRIDADVRVDAAGNQPPVVSAGPDQTIAFPATAQLNGSANDDGLPNPPAALTTTWSTFSGPGTVTFGNAHALATTASFSQGGVYVLRLSANDGSLGSSDDVQITVNTTGNQNPTAQADSTQTFPGNAVQLNVLSNDSDPNGDALTVVSSTQGAHGGVACLANGTCTYTPNAGFVGQDTFTYTASDGRGGQATGSVTVNVAAGDATLSVPPLSGSPVTLLSQATQFLYSGVNPVQTGVAPGTIEARRAAVLRGKVTRRDGNALPGVTVSILNHPELGQTISRSNGFFDMAVNGGGSLTINYAAAGFLPLQKQINVPWQDYVAVPQVALISLDAQVTTITANAGAAQLHQASMMTDADGSRRLIVLIPAGTTATMTLPGGSTQPLSTMHVRATEYTVGANGPMAMPANLPGLSGYTYCVELSVDEAISAGATGVVFSQPVITYVENFLHFPVGMNVPVGIYDRAKGVWVPSANGRIVKILGFTGGLADLDTDGDNVADNGLGIASEERQRLASLFSVGQTLWRVPIAHFSPGDSNWPFTTPDDATSPADNGAGPDPNDPLEDPTCSEGSIVQCENQVLGEAVPIVGTPYSLNYSSDRVPGRAASRTITLSGPSVPSSLASISLHMSVAGRDFDQTFAASPNQQTTFTWDRLDAYGRQVVGGQTLSGKIDYNYPTMYRDPGPLPAAFNSVGGVTLRANPGRQQIAISQSFTATLGEGLTDARTLGMGGWTLNVHHVYDPNARVVHLGNGSRRRAGSLARTITFTDLVGQSILFDVEIGPDGSQFVALPHGDQIMRIAPNGSQSAVAGNGIEGFSGDGGPATQAMLGDPTGIAIAPDGSLYIAEEANRRVRKVSPDGIISTVAGTGASGFSGDGGPATQATLLTAERIALGADSSLYILDGGRRIRRVGTDGIIRTVAGNGAVGFTGDGGPATAAALNAAALAVAPDGTVYIADVLNGRVRRVKPNGIIDTIANYTSIGGQPVSVRLTSDGGLLTALQFTSARTPQVDLLKTDGSIVTVAGGGPSPIAQGVPATQANLVAIRSMAPAPDGSIFIVTGDASSRVLRVGPALPGFEGAQYFIVNADGSQLYLFDVDGKHLRTQDALTGGILYEFGYDANGRLIRVTEKTGGTDNVTTIQRDGAGNPTAIVGPFGQITTLGLDANGFLARISNPAGEAVQLTSDSGGLLSTFTDPRGKTSRFAFESDGRLRQDADAVGGTQDLARTTVGNQFTVTRTTALGRTTTYATQNRSGNVQQRTVTEPDGTLSQTLEAIDAGTTHATSSDGMSYDKLVGPDPRFGMQAPISKTDSVASPAGLLRAASSNVTATLSNPLDPLSLISLTQTNTIDGRTTTAVYTAATRVFATTTPAGRTSSSTVDSLGRLVSDQFSGLDPTNFTYDNRGHMATVTQGSGPSARTATFTYNPEGFVQSITDAIGRITQFTYDAAGRVVSKTLPDGRVATFGYDAAGNMVSAAPPGRPAHTFTYSDRNELTVVTPPPVPGSGPTSYDHNLDKQVTTTARPDGRTISFGYDASGRLSTRTFATNNVTTSTDTRSYDTAGRLARIAAASGVATDYAYDGLLLTSTNWSGPISGSVSRSYDTSFRPSSQSVNGANTINLSYDNDDLLIGVGNLTITRSPQTGLPTASSLGVVNAAAGFNGFGELVSYDASAGANSIFSNTYTRDALGRLTQKTETIGGVTDAYNYTYDAAGQLIGVSKNAVAAEAYTYDANGNRIGATVGGISATASYDDQDRLNQYGAATYTYNGAGDLLTKTSGAQTTNYQYDQLGNLLGVTLANGTTVAYIIDGSSRRIGKKINGTLTKGFLYGDRLRVAAELDGSGAIVSRFVYGTNHFPLYLLKGGVAFRIITDQVGSVRLVVNSATGAIVQRMDYDSFGNVTQDSAPGFQPFGFAGGIYDPDTGLVRFGARDYDAAVGRWTTKDPISFAGQDGNLYRYAGNQPVNRIDPIGLGVVADVIGGYMDALLDSYKAIFLLPLVIVDDLNFIGVTNIDYRQPVYGPLGIDDKSKTFKYSKIGCEVIGGGIAAGQTIAARLAEKPLEFIIESDEVVAKQIEKANRRMIVDKMQKGLEQVLADQRGSANTGTK